MCWEGGGRIKEKAPVQQAVSQLPEDRCPIPAPLAFLQAAPTVCQASHHKRPPL